MAGLFSADARNKVWTYRGTFLLGLENTAVTALFALVLALALGILFGLFATSGKQLPAFLARVYVEVIQNTPVLLQMCFLYYALAFSKHSIGIINTGILTRGMYYGAYMAEVVRAGIEAIPKGQLKAAASQGFGYLQRMYYVILPQCIKIILPPIVNQVVNLIKNTSCLYIVGGAYAPAYLVSGLIFFMVCCLLSSLASMWEISLKKRDVRTGRPAKSLVRVG